MPYKATFWLVIIGVCLLTLTSVRADDGNESEKKIASEDSVAAPVAKPAKTDNSKSEDNDSKTKDYDWSKEVEKPKTGIVEFLKNTFESLLNVKTLVILVVLALFSNLTGKGSSGKSSKSRHTSKKL